MTDTAIRNVRAMYEESLASILNNTEWISPKSIEPSDHTTYEEELTQVEAWLRDHKLFCFEIDGLRVLPSYQLGCDGEPLPVIAEVLRIFKDYSALRIASWFHSPTYYLDGSTPRSLIADDPSAVIEAAALYEGYPHDGYTT